MAKLILSSEDIVSFLYTQAGLRAPENDMAGALIDAANKLRKEAIELGDWDEASVKYVEAAKLEAPSGAVCGWCGQENNFADDCGWFMCNPLAYERHSRGERWEFSQEPKDFRYTCEACYRGGVGERHTAYYGESDR